VTGSTKRLSSGGPWEDAFGYSRVVVVGDLAWTAGCTAVVDGKVVGPGDAHAQAVAALTLALEWLRRAGFDRRDVVRSHLFVLDVARNGDAVGRAHAEVLGDVRPAATMLGVAALVDPSLLVEVELVAARVGA
jgi:enamine deaminase RidA (YjgF/YER057c/UK114 family)